jgi:hypothetical protein
VQQVGVREARVGHLQVDPLHAPELLGDPQDLVGDGPRVADEERAVRPAHRVERPPGRRHPAALGRDGREHLLPPRVERVGGLGDVVAEEAEAVQPHPESLRRVAGLRPGPAVELA